MNLLLMWCTLVLFLCLSSEEMAEAKREPAIGQLYGVTKGQYNVRNSKRHSDGTFTSDFTRYLDKIKAKDFVEWLTSTKREGCHEEQFHVAAGV